MLFALFWLLLVRPQRRRQAERQQLLADLEVGDEIVSTGGVFGIVREVGETEIHVEIADGVVVRMARGAVAGYVERDEPAAAEAPEQAVEAPEQAAEAPTETHTDRPPVKPPGPS